MPGAVAECYLNRSYFCLTLDTIVSSRINEVYWVAANIREEVVRCLRQRHGPNRTYVSKDSVLLIFAGVLPGVCPLKCVSGQKAARARQIPASTQKIHSECGIELLAPIKKFVH